MSCDYNQGWSASLSLSLYEIDLVHIASSTYKVSAKWTYLVYLSLSNIYIRVVYG